MTRKFSDRIKVTEATERADKDSAHELATEAYDTVFVAPEAMSDAGGTTRGTVHTYDTLEVPNGATVTFNIGHRPDWTMGGSLKVELYVLSSPTPGLVDIQISERGWKEQAGAPTSPDSLGQSFDASSLTVEDLIVLEYWDTFRSEGDERLHGFEITNNGVTVVLLGATVRHYADRV